MFGFLVVATFFVECCAALLGACIQVYVQHGTDHPGDYASTGTALHIPYIGALPTDVTQADCVKRAAERSGLVWVDGRGWRAPDQVPEPALTGDPTEVVRKIADWQSKLNAYVAQHQSDWSYCTAPPPPKQELKPPAPEQITIGGSYTLQNGVTSGNACGSEQVTNIVVTDNAGKVKIIATVTTSPPMSVELNGDRTGPASFEVSGGYSTPQGNRLVTMGGVFAEASTGVILQSGTVRISTPDGDCSTDFTAQKSGSGAGGGSTPNAPGVPNAPGTPNPPGAANTPGTPNAPGTPTTECVPNSAGCDPYGKKIICDPVSPHYPCYDGTTGALLTSGSSGGGGTANGGQPSAGSTGQGGTGTGGSSGPDNGGSSGGGGTANGGQPAAGGGGQSGTGTGGSSGSGSGAPP